MNYWNSFGHLSEQEEVQTTYPTDGAFHCVQSTEDLEDASQCSGSTPEMGCVTSSFHRRQRTYSKTPQGLRNDLSFPVCCAKHFAPEV